MCGIIGSFHRSPTIEFESQWSSALNLIRHRGPDDEGTYKTPVGGGFLRLGHKRLSIIDLSAGGHQPMHSIDGRYTVVFNGEIYNYRELREELLAEGFSFRSDSDTEVLLCAWAKWGAQSLPKFTGMFAFAVFDNVEMTLTLARDAFGIKPLYYWLDDLELRFSSELPSLLTMLPVPYELDLQCAYNYLVYGVSDIGMRSFVKSVNVLPSGHFMKVSFNGLQTFSSERWWWPSITLRYNISFEDAAAQLRDLFLKSVRLHLRSDVPLGAALSGGLDSSALVCAMRLLEPDMPIHTFSFVARGSDVDEEHWIDIVNQHVGAIPHKVFVESEELIADLDDMIAAQGQPFGGTSIYAQYRVFKAARETGVTVTLDGQGADEMLAGYQGYPQGYIGSLLDRSDYLGVIRFVLNWSRWPGRGLKRSLLEFVAAIAPKWSLTIAYRAIGFDANPGWLDTAWLRERGVTTEYPVNLQKSPEGHGRRLVEQLRHALTEYGLPELMRHGDRNSMRWSIESRVPFLTTEIAEFLLSLPEEYLLSPQGETKHVFRAAMRGIVPDEILDRKDKIGFRTPEKAG